jgi:predicted MFS family arabinose efflux permease
MKSHSHASRALTLLTIASFAGTAAIRICDPMLPQIAQAFDTTSGQAAGTITAFAVAYGLFQIIYGPLGDRYNKYRLIMLATYATTIGTLLAAVSPSLSWLIFSRALAAATAAGIAPLTMAWIGDTVPYAERQATLARFLSGPILGLISGQFLGGFVADTLGWRWCFVLMAAIYVIIGVLLQIELRHDRSLQHPVEAKPDSAKKASYFSQFTNILKIHWTKIILITVFCEGFALFGSASFIPAYLHITFGLSLTAAGAIMAAFGVGGLFYTVIAKRLLPRIGEQGFALTGGTLIGLAFLIFLICIDWLWAIPASFMMGLGFYMLHNTLQTNATQMAPFARGTAVALFVVCFFSGQSAGVALGAIVFDRVGPFWMFAYSAIIIPSLAAGFSLALRYLRAKH